MNNCSISLTIGKNKKPYGAYFLLLREVVCQLGVDTILVGGNLIKSTIATLDFNKLPKVLRNKIYKNGESYSGSVAIGKLNTSSKVNINYITENIFNKEDNSLHSARRISPELFRILKDTKYNQNEDELIFKNENDLNTFLKFKYFQSINSDIYNCKEHCIKNLTKSLQLDEIIKKVNRFNNMDGETASVYYEDKKRNIITSNIIPISYYDFFNQDGSLKSLNNIINGISLIVDNNQIVEHSKLYNTDYYLSFLNSLKSIIEKHYNKLKIM